MLADKTKVVKRSSKGTPLTYVEMDRNFAELVNLIDDVSDMSNTFTSSYNGAEPLKLGDYYVWVDATGVLRTKSGVPTSDTDGLPQGQKVSVPASATAAGSLGQWAADESFYYVCTANSTWKRTALSTW